MDRKSYWNEQYLEYWKNKVDEANRGGQSLVTANDCKTSADAMAYKLFDKLEYRPHQKLLDFGCGFGRFYRFFSSQEQDYYGIDISNAMIEETKKRYPEITKQLFVTEGEALPFLDEMFDNIICYGVFDACYQEAALGEMIRVCTRGGGIILSGKNSIYFPNDKLALIAEENARKIGHPNYFTNVKEMMRQLRAAGIDIIHEEYFLMRKDLETGDSIHEMPTSFYAWQIILHKSNIAKNIDFCKFSDAYSDTWKNMKLMR